MPRGVKRSEVEIVQAEILAAEKKREKSLKEAAEAKKAISKLQDKIDQQYAREIAKACRASGIPLEEVLGWVKERQAESLGEAPPAPKVAKPAAKRKPMSRAKSPRKPAGRGKKIENSDAATATLSAAETPET